MSFLYLGRQRRSSTSIGLAGVGRRCLVAAINQRGKPMTDLPVAATEPPNDLAVLASRINDEQDEIVKAIAHGADHAIRAGNPSPSPSPRPNLSPSNRVGKRERRSLLK